MKPPSRPSSWQPPAHGGAVGGPPSPAPNQPALPRKAPISVWMWRASIGLVVFGGLLSVVGLFQGFGWYLNLSTSTGRYFQQNAAHPLRTFGFVGVLISVTGGVAVGVWGRERLQAGLAVAIGCFVLAMGSVVTSRVLYHNARNPWPEYRSELDTVPISSQLHLVGTFDGGGDINNPPASARVWTTSSSPSDTCAFVTSWLSTWLDANTLHTAQLNSTELTHEACRFEGTKAGNGASVEVGLTLDDVASYINSTGPATPGGSTGPALVVEISGD